MNFNDLDEVLSIAASSPLNPWSKNMFIGEMRNPFSHSFTVRIQETSNPPVLGFICFRNIEDESELLNICIHPEHRLSGIGKTLMQFYIGFCTKRKITTFYLDVDASNRIAVNLYQSFSYQLLGIRKNFYQGKFDALLMVKKI
jgi:ribosomal-protein-alanine N-acetyltransferase